MKSKQQTNSKTIYRLVSTALIGLTSVSVMGSFAHAQSAQSGDAEYLTQRLEPSSASFEPSGKVTAVDQVNLTRYGGLWYEIANFPAFFQKDCTQNVTAEYRMIDDQSIEVINSCDTAKGRKVASGTAWVQDGSDGAKLKVSFLPEVIRWLPVGRGDYWVLRLDSDYQTALVGEPSRKYLWILSRSPSISDETYLEYARTAAKMGYDVSNLKRTRQTSAR